jgi:hypothetical protein
MDLGSLFKKSDGSFIFVVTLINFIRNGRGLPQRRPQKALKTEVVLDNLFAQILEDALHGENFEQVIGTIMLLHPSLYLCIYFGSELKTLCKCY